MWQDEEGRRRMRLTFAVVAISALMMIGLPVASHGDPLPFESIDVPHAAPTVPNGINSKGQIVGLFRDATEDSRLPSYERSVGDDRRYPRSL